MERLMLRQCSVWLGFKLLPVSCSWLVATTTRGKLEWTGASADLVVLFHHGDQVHVEDVPPLQQLGGRQGGSAFILA